ncbi:hypothetical protein ACFSTC_27025 [Nonomuraea ferruginea]
MTRSGLPARSVSPLSHQGGHQPVAQHDAGDRQRAQPVDGAVTARRGGGVDPVDEFDQGWHEENLGTAAPDPNPAGELIRRWS